MYNAICLVSCRRCNKKVSITKAFSNEKMAAKWSLQMNQDKSKVLCEDCANNEKLEYARQESKNIKLPVLVGTEDQINWATVIRSKFVHKVLPVINICNKITQQVPVNFKERLSIKYFVMNYGGYDSEHIDGVVDNIYNVVSFCNKAEAIIYNATEAKYYITHINQANALFGFLPYHITAEDVIRIRTALTNKEKIDILNRAALSLYAYMLWFKQNSF